MEIIDDIFFDLNPREFFTPDNKIIKFKIGYSPTAKHYFSIRDYSTGVKFCFSANSVREAEERAFNALEFYYKHGLVAVNDPH